MKIVKEERAIAELEDGSYIARFEGVEEREINVGGSVRKVLVFKFDVDGQTVEGLTTTVVSPLSKAYKWLKAINDDKDFEEIDTDDLVGKEVTVKVANRVRASGIKFPSVVDVFPVPKTAKKK